MKTKKIEKTLVAKHSLTTTLKEVMSQSLTQGKTLMEEVAKQGFDVHVPHIWHYIACDGQVDTPFTLEMCIPVDKKGKDTDFVRFEELPQVNTVVHTHEGAYSELSSAYCTLFGEIEKGGVKPLGNCREVYLNYDMENETNNVTEIQVEVE
jgi:effector-binding domain-containing protein